MALKMTSREVDGVTVVALDGRIVLGEESNALREKIKSMVAEGKKKIVLKMDGVKGCLGNVGVLPMGWNAVSDPPSPCRKMFSMTELFRFPVCPNVSTAVTKATTAPRATLLG